MSASELPYERQIAKSEFLGMQARAIYHSVDIALLSQYSLSMCRVSHFKVSVTSKNTQDIA